MSTRRNRTLKMRKNRKMTRKLAGGKKTGKNGLLLLKLLRKL